MGVASRLERVGPDAERYRRLLGHLEPVGRRVRSRFEVDTRALAAVRISFGLILLVDLLVRWGNIEQFYTDDGAYPIEAYEATYSQFTGLSVHALSGELWFQQLLFGIAGLFALAFVLGYRTRLVGFVSLGLLLSLQARNPAVLNGGDKLLRVLLFLALLTPLGERWSVDALRRGSARASVVGFGTAALLIQPLMVFSQNAVLKHQGNTWYEGEALQIAMSNDVMTIFLGNHLTAYPTLLEAMNWAWVGLLAGSVLFLLVTDGRVRAAFALVYVGAFAGMLLTMSVGLFPLVLTTALLPFLTPPFWDALRRLVPTGLLERLPSRARLESIAGRPLERRAFDALEQRGYESKLSFVRAYCRSLLTVVSVLALVSILLYGTAYVTDHDLPDELETSVDQQQWGLYAPNPTEGYSWYAVEAQLESGEEVDAFGNGTITDDRPPDASKEYDTFRERKFMQTVWASGNGDTDGIIAVDYAEWACEQAIDRRGDSVESITVHRFYQPSPIDGEYEETGRFTVVEQAC
ncbi:HTTM domain-containing protein [Halostagnicola kamekurae]|uniref:Vitamin K-dependent gamma-carboxylase n=1 Tax=Halostagnicola kamekurae TaxID=619731 RepID=A0A1I6PXD6_9EURY|nr:HTTM domain-containing protein [Halostagnicola kamekurae]SFS44886.1 Vitamin K-dependent gamma-carboxylase [Halostagnicola kamekurae]